MSYNRQKSAGRQQERDEWRAWCKEQVELIQASRVPATVFADAAHWRDFLEMGDLYPVDFDHQAMTLSQKVALLRLINTRPSDRRTPVAGSLIDTVLDALEPRM